MKKLLVFACLALSVQLAMSQIFSYGLKGGVQSSKMKFDKFDVNYPPNSTGDVKVKVSPSDPKMGFHVGAFARVKVLGFFVQPEAYFSNTSSTINVENPDLDINEVATLKMNKIDVPILVGMKFGPARIDMGPVATFNLSSKTKGSDQVKSIIGNGFESSKSATFGYQVGVGLDILRKLTLDVRYEFGLSKLGDKVSINGQEFKTDQRINQFVGSIGWMF